MFIEYLLFICVHYLEVTDNTSCNSHGVKVPPQWRQNTSMMKFRNCHVHKTKRALWGHSIRIFRKQLHSRNSLLDISGDLGSLCFAPWNPQQFPACIHQQHQRTVLEKGHIPIAGVSQKCPGDSHCPNALPKRLSQITPSTAGSCLDHGLSSDLLPHGSTGNQSTHLTPFLSHPPTTTRWYTTIGP